MRSLSFLSVLFFVLFSLNSIPSDAKTKLQLSCEQTMAKALARGDKIGCYDTSNGSECEFSALYCKTASACTRYAGGTFDAATKTCKDPIAPAAAIGSKSNVNCGPNADPNPDATNINVSAMTADKACKCRYSDSYYSASVAYSACPLDPNKTNTCGSGAKDNFLSQNDDDVCECADGTTLGFGKACPESAKASATSPEIESCLSSLTQKVQACTTSADKAVKSCDAESTLSKEQESNNSNIKTGQQVLNAIGQLSVGQKVGSGEVNACVLTTLGTQTAAGLLDTFKEGCASDVSSCTSDCDGIQDLLKNSTAIYAQCGMNIDFNSATSQSMSKRAQIDQKIEELSAAFSSADNNCNTNAKGKKTVLEETAGRSVASAQQAAKVCNCQNVAGATNCNNLPTMAQCKLTPGLSGCAIYQNNCVANPNSPACVCVTDPNGNACKLSLNNNPNLQGMVAALNTLPTTNGNVSTGSAYGMKSVKDLIGSLGDEATKVASATTDTGGPASPFATAQGGGGMGGGAGGGGGIQQGEGGPAAEEEKKGIGGGFITSAKNFLSDMFGGKKGGNGVGGVGNGFKVKPNPDAWRPKLRIPGSAGDEYALGSKNKNIFDIMTKRYSDQTHTFIQTP